jgi:hypothetical protein
MVEVFQTYIFTSPFDRGCQTVASFLDLSIVFYRTIHMALTKNSETRISRHVQSVNVDLHDIKVRLRTNREDRRFIRERRLEVQNEKRMLQLTECDC